MARALKLIFAALLFAGLTLMGMAPTQAKQSQLTSGTPLSPADKKHLLEDNFVLATKVAAIPLLVQKEMLGSGIRGGMADAGQPYEISDMVGPKPLPFRRLVFAGTSPGYCVVYNEYGGFATGQDVSLYRLLPGKATLVWYADLQNGRKCLSLLELRRVIDKGKFHSHHLPVAFRVY